MKSATETVNKDTLIMAMQLTQTHAYDGNEKKQLPKNSKDDILLRTGACRTVNCSNNFLNEKKQLPKNSKDDILLRTGACRTVNCSNNFLKKFKKFLKKVQRIF